MSTRNRAKDTIVAFGLKKPDLLWGSFFVVDAFGNVERKIHCQAFDEKLNKEKKLNFICHSTMAYTKKLSMDVRYDEGEFSRLGMDDWKLQWDAYRRGYSLRHLKTPLCYYRATDDGTTATRDNDQVDKVKEAFLAGL